MTEGEKLCCFNGDFGLQRQTDGCLQNELSLQFFKFTLRQTLFENEMKILNCVFKCSLISGQFHRPMF